MNEQTIWNNFFQQIDANPIQQGQFEKYYSLLIETNEIHNLTAITDLRGIVEDHFQDSLALTKFANCKALSSLADVGTGAGFPGLPLKIMFPHVRLTLIEVNQKKVTFLHTVIEQLGLENIDIIDIDWRTFLRTAHAQGSIDLFCARASLQPDELVRMFMPSSVYKDALLVYWASQQWKPTKNVADFIARDELYAVGGKKRRLVFFKAVSHL